MLRRESRSQVIALMGESLLMDTIEASLRTEPDLKTVRSTLDPAAQEPWPAMLSLIIIDLNCQEQNTVLSCIEQFPKTPILGIDVTTHRVIAITCEPYSVRSTQDLTSIIRNQMRPSREKRSPGPYTLSLSTVSRL